MSELHVRTRIKLCGMTRSEDVRLATALGVDFIGLIFARRSKRCVSLEQAQMLRTQAMGHAFVVALLMDNPADEVQQVVEWVKPDYLQFHGAENDVFCASFGVPFFKAVAMGKGADPHMAMASFPSAYGFVLDGHAVGEMGGSGLAFDWKQLPQQADKPILLAGGLGPHNVAEAIATAHPWGVDVSSGIESGGIEAAPGIKDAQAMRAFVAAVRATDRSA